MDRHTAPSWAQPDTKRACAVVPGHWDVYCVACGWFIACMPPPVPATSTAAPASMSCARCSRTAQLAAGALTVIARSR